jgi:hypothetical protein
VAIENLGAESFPPPNSNKMNANAMANAVRQTGIFANRGSSDRGSEE